MTKDAGGGTLIFVQRSIVSPQAAGLSPHTPESAYTSSDLPNILAISLLRTTHRCPGGTFLPRPPPGRAYSTAYINLSGKCTWYIFAAAGCGYMEWVCGVRSGAGQSAVKSTVICPSKRQLEMYSHAWVSHLPSAPYAPHLRPRKVTNP